MKGISTLCILLFASLFTLAQQKTNIIIMSNKEGKLIIDAAESLPIKANEAAKITLDEGEHIIQIQSGTETLSKTINCADGKQKVLTFEFDQSPIKSPENEAILVTVADTEIDLPGAIGQQGWLNKYYTFDQGDEITFNLKVLNKKGTVNIYIYSYPDNALVFSKQTEQEVTNQKITIPKRGIYRFSLATNHVFNRSAHFTVRRKPISETGRAFKTSVRLKYDTSYQDVLNTQVRVHSRRNDNNPNKTTVRINLPENTSYWVYWIGVGQESKEGMKAFTDHLAKTAEGLFANPIYALGIGLISKLPVFNTTATVGYRFTDYTNSQNFLYGKPYSYFTFKEGNAVTTDYSIIKTVGKDLNFCLWNNTEWDGHDVQIKVGAFIIKATYIPEE